MIELTAIERRYAMSGQTVQALAGIDLAIGAGEFVAVTGASGSGKSTLLNVLGCLDKPDAGTYRLDGTDVARLDDEATSQVRNARIGFVFQSFHLLPRLTVLENVLLPLRTPAPRRARATCCSASAWASAWSTAPASCPAARCSAPRSRARC
jgi:putative ABC transport system ATP-binding protein